jgi:hypothetical protein
MMPRVGASELCPIESVSLASDIMYTTLLDQAKEGFQHGRQMFPKEREKKRGSVSLRMKWRSDIGKAAIKQPTSQGRLNRPFSILCG